MECTGENFFPASRQENGIFEVWPVRPNFLIFAVVALVLTVIFQRKNQNHCTCKSDQSRDDGFLEDFLAARPET